MMQHLKEFAHRHMGPQTKKIIFLKVLLQFGMEIYHSKKSNEYLMLELLFTYDFKTV